VQHLTGGVSKADAIRAFARDRFVVPARQGGLSKVIIRAGDVHRAMELTSAMPAVCSALAGRKFEGIADVRLRNRTGPAFG
jgi:5-methylcytosine-specific restriction enzyme B